MSGNYQFDYAAQRPQMYDIQSREQKGVRMVKALEHYFGHDKLRKLRVLDVGASTGIIDNILAKSFGSVTGIDIDKVALYYARSKYKKQNLTFKLGDAMKLQFKDNSFDVVICAHVYEHVPSAKNMFNEIYRVLKPKGVCYLAAINSLWPMEPHYDLLFLSWLPKKLANIYTKIFDKADKYHETPQNYWQLSQIVRDSGFKRVDYTDKIINNPEIFGYPKIWKILSPISLLAPFLSPTFFWILKK